VRDLVAEFRNGERSGLDGVSSPPRRGELVCVMGASGCGKSTLLKVIAGSAPAPARAGPLQRAVALQRPEQPQGYVTYIPQDDAFDEHLTIGENLDFAAAHPLAPPVAPRPDRRIEGKLAELGLNERATASSAARSKRR
jgi:ABC-type multidrug transport system ATPase subunit